MAFSFAAHVALFTRFLDRRPQILEAIESRLLNVQGKEVSRAAARGDINQILSSCFFDSSLSPDLAQLRDQLSTAHRTDGFEPVPQQGRAHDFEPAQLVVLAYAFWTNSRWPGRNVRLAYAQTIYSSFVLRQLEQLTLRIWDDGTDRAKAGLQEIQRLLDRLNQLSGTDPFVRTAPWLLQTAQGPLTRHLQSYFAIAERIAGSFEDTERLDIHRAGALLAGGHLRSQLRYRARESQRSPDDPDVLSVTRNSNSMDAALLIRDLVPLLETYKTACSTDGRDTRLTLADAILQGLSADPELFLTRLDVLGPATMIEEVFIERKEDGSAAYTAFGRSHLHTLAKYRELIGTVAVQLKEDAQRLDPTRSVYSPLGIVYGFCADILSNMAIARINSPQTFGLTLEDVFSSVGALDSKLARTHQWERLPSHSAERERFEHSTEWAVQMFDRLITALDARAVSGDSPDASGLRQARLFVLQQGHSEDSLFRHTASAQMIRAQEHCVTSDLKRALATDSTAFPKSQILSDRKEGRFLASVESGGQWFAVSKVLLTTCICQGKDALISDVPTAAIEALRLTCAEFLELPC
jgi:hypothetical protein